MSSPGVRPLVATSIGSGPPLVALHASGMSGRQFARLVRDGMGRYRVHAADLLGAGETPLPGGTYSLDAEVSALIALLEGLGEQSFVFGHSYGGLVAAQTALRAPALFRALALYEPVTFGLALREGSDAAREEIARIDEGMTVPVDGDYARWIEFFIDWWNGPGFYRTLPAPTQAQYLSTAGQAHRQACAVSSNTVTREALSKLSVPTLLLTGVHSPTSARESAAIAADALPRGTLRRIEGAGHMGPLTHTAVVNSAVLAFFDAQRG
jgi:pimeloyl-ACP methyl ester carboxylesterase